MKDWVFDFLGLGQRSAVMPVLAGPQESFDIGRRLPRRELREIIDAE